MRCGRVAPPPRPPRGAIALTIEATPGLPPAIADAERLRQILANLIHNAIRHALEGGIIALHAYQEGPWVVAQVADTGDGIAAEHLAHIFDRFYRVDTARRRTSGGAGAGNSTRARGGDGREGDGGERARRGDLLPRLPGGCPRRGCVSLLLA